MIQGAVFGSLTTVSKLHNYKKWFCRCSCGSELLVQESELKNGNRKSCGCRSSLRKFKVGDRFGRLVITSIQPVIADCDCGVTTSIKHISNLRKGIKQSCGCLALEQSVKNQESATKKYRVSRGFSPDEPMGEVNKAQRLIFSRTIRGVALERDDYKCALCNSEQDIEVHHIRRWATNETLRFDLRNVITLCQTCHIGKAHKGNTRAKVCVITSKKLQDIVDSRMGYDG